MTLFFIILKIDMSDMIVSGGNERIGLTGRSDSHPENVDVLNESILKIIKLLRGSSECQIIERSQLCLSSLLY